MKSFTYYEHIKSDNDIAKEMNMNKKAKYN